MNGFRKILKYLHPIAVVNRLLVVDADKQISTVSSDVTGRVLMSNGSEALPSFKNALFFTPSFDETSPIVLTATSNPRRITLAAITYTLPALSALEVGDAFEFTNPTNLTVHVNLNEEDRDEEGIAEAFKVFPNQRVTARSTSMGWIYNFQIASVENLQYDGSQLSLQGLKLLGGQANQLLATNGDRQLVTLSTNTYPSLAELAHVKNLTSSAQTQLNDLASLKFYITSAETLQSQSLFEAYMAGVTTTTVDSTETLLGSFPTAIGFPNLTKLFSGTIRAFYQTQKISGSNSYYTYYKLYKKASDDTETLLVTSNVSDNIAENTAIDQILSYNLATSLTLGTNYRLVLKIYARMTTDTTATIQLRYDGVTGARVEIPAIAADASNQIPYTGATQDIDLNNKVLRVAIIRGLEPAWNSDEPVPLGQLFNSIDAVYSDDLSSFNAYNCRNNLGTVEFLATRKRNEQIDLNTTDKQTLFTIAAGKVFLITRVVLLYASTTLDTAEFSFGWNSDADDVIAPAIYNDLGSNGYIEIRPKRNALVVSSGDDPAHFGVKCVTPQGVTANCEIHVFGYYLP